MGKVCKNTKSRCNCDIKEIDVPLVNITHNHGENDNSINGYAITINLPKNIFDIFHNKLDTLITLMAKDK
jgi:hypothetical protein